MFGIVFGCVRHVFGIVFGKPVFGKLCSAITKVRSQNPGRREKRGEKSEQRTLDWDALLGRMGVPKVWNSELQKLQNEALRHQKPFPEASRTCEGPLGTLRGFP